MTHLSRRAFTATIAGAAAAATRGAEATFGQAGRSTVSVAPAASPADALAGLTLSDASARIKAGTVTSTELVSACLARIDVHNPQINAFITVLTSAVPGVSLCCAARSTMRSRT